MFNRNLEERNLTYLPLERFASITIEVNEVFLYGYKFLKTNISQQGCGFYTKHTKTISTLGVKRLLEDLNKFNFKGVCAIDDWEIKVFFIKRLLK